MVGLSSTTEAVWNTKPNLAGKQDITNWPFHTPVSNGVTQCKVLHCFDG
jgi:hypothetical protein